MDTIDDLNEQIVRAFSVPPATLGPVCALLTPEDEHLYRCWRAGVITGKPPVRVVHALNVGSGRCLDPAEHERAMADKSAWF